MLKEELSSLKTNDAKETHILSIATSHIDARNYPELKNLITQLQEKWDNLTTARLTKIIRQLFERISIAEETYHQVLQLLDDLIEWSENKKLLRIELQCRQIQVFLSVGMYSECLKKISDILPDLKKYDDKVNMISVHVYESRAYYELKDFPRAKSALTSARALAVCAACPSHLQAQVDLLSGMYISDEGAYGTSTSYFIESIEGFVQDRMYENARVVLRYIVLSKIMDSRFDEVPRILESKYASAVRDDEYVKLLIYVAKACRKRDLGMYSNILQQNSELINSDKYVFKHLQKLYHDLLDQNIHKLIEPYSHIRIAFIAKKLGFEEDVIEDKLRRMILDGAICGILDHVSQCLIIYPPEQKEKCNPAAIVEKMVEYVDAE